MGPMYSRSNLFVSLKESVKKIATYYPTTHNIDVILEKISEKRVPIKPSDTFGRIAGIDGSLNSIEIFGNLKLYAVTAVSYGFTEKRPLISIATVVPYYETPHTPGAVNALMSALEAFSTFVSVKDGVDYVFVDGGPKSIYIAISGRVAGILDSLTRSLLMIVKEVVIEPDNYGLAKKIDEGVYVVDRSSLLHKAIQEGLKAGYKELRKAFDFHGKVDEDALLAAILGSSFSAFKSAFLSKIEETLESDLTRNVEERILRERYALEPMINAFAAYGVYINALDKTFEYLERKDSLIIGASKRINRASINLGVFEAPDLDLRSRIGYALTGPMLESPGYMEIVSSHPYGPPEMKLTGHVDGINRVREYFEGKRNIRIKEVLYKPSRRSILRLEIYSRNDVDLKEVLSVIASKSLRVPAGSSTLSLYPIEIAHRIASVSNDIMNNLRTIFLKNLSIES